MVPKDLSRRALRRGRLLGVAAQLLRPPLGLAAVEVLLELRDVHGEIAFPGRQLGLELGAGLLALLQALLAHLELGLQLRLAEVQGGLTLLELLGAAGEHVLVLVERLLLALVAAARREDRLLRLVQRRLARPELLVARLQPPLRQLVDLRLARLLQLAAQRSLSAMELRLPGNQLRLALLDVCQLRARVVGGRLRLLRLALELVDAR